MNEFNGDKVNKHPWLNNVIRFICGCVLLFIGLVLWGFVSIFDIVYMFFKGFYFDVESGYYFNRKTGERQ